MKLQTFIYQTHIELYTLHLKYAFSRHLKFIGRFHHNYLHFHNIEEKSNYHVPQRIMSIEQTMLKVTTWNVQCTWYTVQ